MAQLTFGDAEFASKGKTTRRERFLAEMDQVVPWKSLLGLIEPFYPQAGNGRQPYPLETMLRGHLMQNWFVHFSVVNLELDKNSRNDEYLYHTISIPTIPNTLLIKKLILPDLFIDQTNLLIFSCGNNEKGLTFDAQKTEQLFDLKNIL